MFRLEILHLFTGLGGGVKLFVDALFSLRDGFGDDGPCEKAQNQHENAEPNEHPEK